MKIKIGIAIAAFAVISVFGAQHAKRFLDIDACLDHGGRWDYGASSCDTSLDFATHFINDYVDFCNAMPGNVTVVQWVSTRADVTQDFKNELKRVFAEAQEHDPQFGLDFDPIVNAQDYPEEGFKLETFDGVTGLAVVSGITWSAFKLPLKFVSIGNRWLLDGAGSIRIPMEKQRH